MHAARPEMNRLALSAAPVRAGDAVEPAGDERRLEEEVSAVTALVLAHRLGHCGRISRLSIGPFFLGSTGFGRAAAIMRNIVAGENGIPHASHLTCS
jgi:hypothetical protein